MAEQLNAARIGDVLDGLVESGFDYEETYTDWQDALWDAWNNNQEDPNVLRAALVYLADEMGSAETLWTPKLFRKLVNDYYKAKYPSNGDFAKEYADSTGSYDADTIKAFTEYIDWENYAESELLRHGDYTSVQIEDDGDVYVFIDGFTY